MFGIFMESLVIFKLYTGLKLLLVLSLISWVYLLFAEKERRNRLLFVYAPLLVIVLFLFPVSRWAFVAAGLDGETYYRILWTIPMGIITVYGFCRFCRPQEDWNGSGGSAYHTLRQVCLPERIYFQGRKSVSYTGYRDQDL